MDPITLATFAAEKGPWAVLVAMLLYALRWSILRGDKALAEKDEANKKAGPQLDATIRALEANTKVLADFNQAQLIEKTRQEVLAERLDRARGVSP